MVAGRRLNTPPPGSAAGQGTLATLKALPDIFQYTRHALGLVWATSRRLTVALALLTLLAGLLPAGIAYVGALIVDAVVAAIAAGHDSGVDLSQVLGYVGLEAVLVAALAATQRGLSTCQSLLRAQLGQRVNVMILEKALTLELRALRGLRVLRQADARAARGVDPPAVAGDAHLRARAEHDHARRASARCWSRSRRWAVAVLLLAGAARRSSPKRSSPGDAFRLFRWRTPETREQMYLETVLAREDHAKEVKLFGLGPLLPRALPRDLREAVRRGSRAHDPPRQLGLRPRARSALRRSTAPTRGSRIATVRGQITLGADDDVRAAVPAGPVGASRASLAAIGGMYEDNLYLSNLYEFLDTPVDEPAGTATAGPEPGDGVRFEDVSFTYPGAREPALERHRPSHPRRAASSRSSARTARARRR